MRSSRFLALAVAVSVAAAACGSGTTTPGATGAGPGASGAAASGPVNSGKIGGKLVIDNESGSTWTCQFNPFNPSVSITSVGFVYEPLEFVNALQTNADGSNVVTPWLATDSTWSSDYKTLTFTIRNGVKWSDGQPFSAADVVYTFNALKGDAAIDLNALWAADGGPLTSVALSGTNQVVFTFSGPAQTYFYYVADQTPIIPQHIWSSEDQTKLDAVADTSPVGTGAYLMNNCTDNNIKYLRNPNYWQSTPGQPGAPDRGARLPGLPQQHPGQPAAGPGPGPVGRPVHPQHRLLLRGQGSGAPPLLVPADAQRGAVPQPRELAAEQPGGAPGHRARHQPDRGLAARRVRLRAAGQPDRHRPAHLPGAGTTSRSTRRPSTPPRPTQTARGRRLHQGLGRHLRRRDGQEARRSRSRRSAATPTGTPRCTVIQQELQAAGIEVTQSRTRTPARYTTDLQGGNFQLAYDEETGGRSAVLRAAPDAAAAATSARPTTRATSPTATDALLRPVRRGQRGRPGQHHLTRSSR